MERLSQLLAPRELIYAIAVSVAATHVTYLWQADQSELLGTSVLLWAGAGTLLWERRERLPLKSDLWSSLAGVGLMALVVLRSFSLAGYHFRLSPAMAFVGLCLLATRARDLGFYWREFLILSLLVLGPAFRTLLEAIDLPTVTAVFSTFMLWYGGFDVTREGTFILLPQGRVEVYGACSGVASVIQMFNIAVLFSLLIPTTWLQRTIATVVALATGFVVNAIRVGLLAVLVSTGSRQAFDFWHEGDGSLIFFTASVLLFSGFCWAFVLRKPAAGSEDEADLG